MRTLHTVEDLKKLIKYVSDTGLFMNVGKTKGRSRIPFAGTPSILAGKSIVDGKLVRDKSKDVHRGFTLVVDKIVYKAHTLAWYLSTGEYCRISHIDGDKTNNKLTNLKPYGAGKGI
jgi:hypothetical protein